MRSTIFTVIFFFLSTSIALAKLTIEVKDLEQKVMKTTYSYVWDKAGSTSTIFPGGVGYNFAVGNIDVISVIEQNTEQDLEFEIVKAKKGEGRAVKIFFPNPVPNGGNYKLQITVNAKTNCISKDRAGRNVFTYETSHETFFVLPKGHAIVYSNYPVLVYEKKEKTVVQVKKEKGVRRNLIFKTRSF